MTVRQTLWLALSMTVVFSVLAAVTLHARQVRYHEQRAEKLRVQAIAETYAELVKQRLLDGAVYEPSHFIGQLPPHRDMRFMAIMNKQGEPVAVRGDKLLLDQYLKLRTGEFSGDHQFDWNMIDHPVQGFPKIGLSVVPIYTVQGAEPMGTLVCAARLSDETGRTAEYIGSFLGPLLLIAGAGIILSFFWIEKKVLEPLWFLSHGSIFTGTQPVDLPTLSNRKDEIGDLARVLNRMHMAYQESREQADNLEQTASHRMASAVEEVIHELHRVEKKIWSDPLTNLGNRRLLDEKFQEIIETQRMIDQDLSIIMIDVDNFKPINDKLGHNTGDKVLKFVGELVKQCVRDNDMAVRYGGDEFLLILPAVAAKDAQAIAERTIRIFTQQARLLNVAPKPSMSAGIASLKEHQPTSAEEIIELADAALYESKKRRNGEAVIYHAPQHIN